MTLVEIKDDQREKVDPNFDKLELFLKYKRKNIRKIDAVREKVKVNTNEGQAKGKRGNSPDIEHYFEKKQFRFAGDADKNFVRQSTLAKDMDSSINTPYPKLENPIRINLPESQGNSESGYTAIKFRRVFKAEHSQDPVIETKASKSNSLLQKRPKKLPALRDKSLQQSEKDSIYSQETVKPATSSVARSSKGRRQLRSIADGSVLPSLPRDHSQDKKKRVFDMYLPYMPSNLKHP